MTSRMCLICLLFLPHYTQEDRRGLLAALRCRKCLLSWLFTSVGGHGAVVAAAREAKCRPTVVRLLLRQLDEGPSEGYRPYLVSANRPDLTSGRPGAVQACLRPSVVCMWLAHVIGAFRVNAGCSGSCWPLVSNQSTCRRYWNGAEPHFGRGCHARGRLAPTHRKPEGTPKCRLWLALGRLRACGAALIWPIVGKRG